MMRWLIVARTEICCCIDGRKPMLGFYR